MSDYSLDENTNQLKCVNENLLEIQELLKHNLLLQCIQTKIKLLTENQELKNVDALHTFINKIYNQVKLD